MPWHSPLVYVSPVCGKRAISDSVSVPSVRRVPPQVKSQSMHWLTYVQGAAGASQRSLGVLGGAGSSCRGVGEGGRGGGGEEGLTERRRWARGGARRARHGRRQECAEARKQAWVVLPAAPKAQPEARVGGLPVPDAVVPRRARVPAAPGEPRGPEARGPRPVGCLYV